MGNQAEVFQFAHTLSSVGVATLSTTFSQPTQGGDTMVVCIAYKNGRTITSVTDSVGNIYIPGIQETVTTGGTNIAAIWTCASAQDNGATPLTITVVLSGNATSFSIVVYEVTNVPPIYSIDYGSLVGYVDNVGTTTPAVSANVIQTGEVLLACVIASEGPVNFSAVGSWRLDVSSNNIGVLRLNLSNFLGPITAAPCQGSAVSPIAMVMIGIVPSNLILPKPVSAKQYPAGGLFELRPFNDTIAALSSDPAWQNPSLSGVAVRTKWSDYQPNNQGQYIWTYTDLALQLAQQNGKAFSVLVEVGVPGVPSWIFGLGAQPFYITGEINPMPAPWDTIFQNAWGNFLLAFGQRYDSVPNLAYVIFIGVGRNGQCDLCQSTTDNANLAAAGGLQTWINAYLQIAQLYANAFKQTPFVSNKGAPIYQQQSQGWYQSSYQCASLYPGLYGIKDNALRPTYGEGQQMAILMGEFTDTNVTGFQEVAAITNSINLQNELIRAVAVGAQFVELYDQSIAFDTGFLDGFNQQLLANAFIRLENLPPPPDFSPPAFNQGGTFLLQTLLNQLFAAGNRTVRDINGNCYPIKQILQSKNWSLLYGIFYYEPNAKRMTYVGSWDTNSLIYINQFVYRPPYGALSVMVPPSPAGGIAPDTIQYQGGVAPYLYDLVGPV